MWPSDVGVGPCAPLLFAPPFLPIHSSPSRQGLPCAYWKRQGVCMAIGYGALREAPTEVSTVLGGGCELRDRYNSLDRILSVGEASVRMIKIERFVLMKTYWRTRAKRRPDKPRRGGRMCMSSLSAAVTRDATSTMRCDLQLMRRCRSSSKSEVRCAT